jgi:cytochrome P450
MEAGRDLRYARETVGKTMAFGAGVHNCIGQIIARLEAETLLQAVNSRVRRVELAGTPEYRSVSALRSLRTLPLVFVA